MPDRFAYLAAWFREHWEWLAGSGVAGTAGEAARRWWRRRQILRATGGVDPDVERKQAEARRTIEQADLLNVESLAAGLRALHETVEAQAADSGRQRGELAAQRGEIADLRKGHSECEERYRALHRDHRMIRENLAKVRDAMRDRCADTDRIYAQVIDGLRDVGK